LVLLYFLFGGASRVRSTSFAFGEIIKEYFQQQIKKQQKEEIEERKEGKRRKAKRKR
jgi:hypothetical protein